MKAHESKSAILFRHWLRANPWWSTSAIETKDTRGKDSFSFSEVSQAQIDYGLAIKGDKGVLLRVVAVSEGMPDYIWLRNAPAWIVIKYPGSIEIVDVEAFVKEKGSSARRSLTLERAKAIAHLSIAVGDN